MEVEDFYRSVAVFAPNSRIKNTEGEYDDSQKKRFSMKALRCAGLSTLFLVLFTGNGIAQSYTISTYAGPPLPFNGAQATGQVIDAPYSVIPDAAGGYYFSGAQAHRVYRVASDGTLTVVAGTGSAGFSGNGGPASSALVNLPRGVALDAAEYMIMPFCRASAACHRKMLSTSAWRIVQMEL